MPDNSAVVDPNEFERSRHSQVPAETLSMLFNSAATEMEEMTAALESPLDAAVDHLGLQHNVDRIERSERAELAPVIVQEIVRRTLKDQSVPDAVRDFVQRDWAKLLTAHCVNEGEQGAHFNSHAETMRELVWSVQPKADMDARLMLVRILPGLLKRLREGVAEIGVPQRLADHFFATLVILHASSVRPNTTPVPLPEVSPEEIDETEAPLEAPAAAASESAAPAIEDAFTEQVRTLNKGDWVEFQHEEGTFLWARLGWVNGAGNTYLFSDRDGMNSFSIDLYRLADKLRRGEAALVERQSITESAFGKLRNLFRQKLGQV